MIRNFFLFLLLIGFTNLQAQIDTEFWFAAPEITANHADSPIFIRISAMDQPCKVTITIPANPLVPPIGLYVAANSTVSFDLTSRLDYLENKPANQILNNGLHVVSTGEITAYYEVLGIGSFGPVNCDIWTLKGKNALGTKFYIPLQNHWDNFDNFNIDAWSSFDIVATEDNTSITITPTQDVVGHAKNIPYTIVLNKGQTYSARATSTKAAMHPSGSLVTSDKPIAISIKDDSMYDQPSWDTAGDQLVPVNLTGNEYIIIKASDTSNSDRAFICATEDATDIYVDGNYLATIQTGETYDYQLTQKYEYIKTSNPVYVNHIGGFERELGGAILPSVTCTGSRRVAFTRPTYDELAINLTVKAGGEKYFKFNGSSSFINPSAFSFVPGTNNVWKAAQIFVPISVVTSLGIGLVTNDSADFHLSIYSGDTETFRYGYFSDFAGLELGPDKVICKGDSIMLNAGFGKSSYLWSTGEKTQKIFVKDTAEYKVTITKAGCKLSDSLKTHYNPPVGIIMKSTDTSACANLPVTIQTDSAYTSYQWSNGSKSRSIKPSASGNYWVEVKNQYGCTRKDTMKVNYFPVPNPSISYHGDLEKLCWDSTITLYTSRGNYKYKWNTGDTTDVITTRHLPEYRVTLTDTNKCKDSTTLVIDCSPFVEVFNLITPDGNGQNETFFVKHLMQNKWILEVFNRWGDRVYYNEKYNNEFGGDEIPAGIYYYVLTHVEGKRTFRGWLHVAKGEIVK